MVIVPRPPPKIKKEAHMKKGKWTAEIYVELEGISYTFEELRPQSRRKIFHSIGRGIQFGELTEQDFITRRPTA